MKRRSRQGLKSPRHPELVSGSTDSEAALFGAELGGGETIDLHGLSVHEALRELDGFVYRLPQNGTAFRVIHGKGSQKLREAVHGWLRDHATDVAAFRDSRNPAETGGVTIAVLRQT